jgi:hypothetical protein
MLGLVLLSCYVFVAGFLLIRLYPSMPEYKLESDCLFFAAAAAAQKAI